MAKHSNNYWESRGATPKKVTQLMKQLGMNPASGNQRMSAFEIMKTMIIARNY